MQIAVIEDFKDISTEVINVDGQLKLLAASEWHKYRWDDFRAFCHNHARYGIPTMEQHQFLYNIIKGRKTIEIGAGAGDLGRHLQIPMTDSRQQEWPEIKAAYDAMSQPVIKYPDDVEELDALRAVLRYKPEVVIASWITTYAPHQMPYGSNPFGVREHTIIELVDTFILIGNKDTHGDKPIMKIPHEEYYFDWIVSRAKNPENNRIWVWSKNE